VSAACRESSLVYQAADGSELPLLVFGPNDGKRPRAGIVLFHGGGLRLGSANDLTPHCQELASHGILAASAGYRLLGQGAASIADCAADVRCAVEEFTRVAASRGVEASHVASGGSSAGAHLALAAAMIAPAPEIEVAAVVALNPAGLDLASFDPELRSRLEVEVGLAAGRLIEYSLIEFVRPGNPPVLIQHGTRDEVEPIDCVRRFRDAMARSGNKCRLLEYENAEHGFHYPGDSGRFDEVMGATARFLLEEIG
jgi:acetyl esterase/lipase